MKIKAIKQTETGLNVEFKNIETGYQFSLEHAIKQIEKGNPNFKNYHIVEKGDVTYIRSNPDNRENNNIE